MNKVVCRLVISSNRFNRLIEMITREYQLMEWHRSRHDSHDAREFSTIKQSSFRFWRSFYRIDVEDSFFHQNINRGEFSLGTLRNHDVKIPSIKMMLSMATTFPFFSIEVHNHAMFDKAGTTLSDWSILAIDDVHGIFTSDSLENVSRKESLHNNSVRFYFESKFFSEVKRKCLLDLTNQYP